MTTSTSYVDNRDHAEIYKWQDASIEALRRAVKSLQAENEQLRHDNGILIAENLELQNLVHKK